MNQLIKLIKAKWIFNRPKKKKILIFVDSKETLTSFYNGVTKNEEHNLIKTQNNFQNMILSPLISKICQKTIN